MVNTIVQYLLFKGMSKIATLRVNSQRQQQILMVTLPQKPFLMILWSK